MKFNLVKHTTFIVLAILTLVIASSVVSIIASARSRSVVATLHQSLLSTRAAEELEIALLEQRGVVAAYILNEGASQRLGELDRSQQAFDDWLAKARELVVLEEQAALLRELEVVYDRYTERRKRVVELYDTGAKSAATELLLVDVNQQYQQAYMLCEEIIAKNELVVDRAIHRADRESRGEFWIVFTIATLCAFLSVSVLWLLFYRVLRPLRRMIHQARDFQFQTSGAALRSPQDEMRAIGFHLQQLMMEVKDARTTLQVHSEQLVQFENLASVGKLASCVAHEIRNPLTAVKMWLFSIRESLPPEATQRSMIDLVWKEIHRLEHIVKHFLEFSRPPQLEKVKDCVQDLIHGALEVVKPFMIEKEVAVDLSLPVNSCQTHVDSGQIMQVISNLLFNAVDASSSGKSIEVTLCSQEHLGTAWHVLRVIDHAGGIAESVKPRIFDPFFTTKEHGSGLGLCIAASIMARHDGRLLLDRSDSQATVFSVWLPADQVNCNGETADH